jgi:hypothetical protein
LIALVLCAALAIVARPLQTVFDEPLSEDGYYVLTVARHIGLGQGVTYDGATPSNGFQPLWVFLCAPLFWLSDGDRVSGIRCVLGFHWVLYALGAILLAALSQRIIGKVADRPKLAALLAALVFLSSPFVWANSFNGLETSLSIVCLLASMLCYIAVDRGNRLHLVGCGVLLGVVVLARIDAVFFVIFLTIVQFLRQNSWRVRIVDALCLAGPALLVSSPWWAFNVLTFGHLTPSSGLALPDWAPTRFRYLSGAVSLLRALTPQFDLLGGFFWSGAIARTVITGAAIYWMWPELRTLYRSLDRSTAEILAALALFIGVLAVWYPTSSWAVFFYTRYLAPASIAAALFWSFVILKIIRHVNRYVVGVGLALMAVQIPTIVSSPSTTIGLGGNIILKEQLPLVLTHVPANDWVGATQSGTLGFLRDRVINLDGRVSFEALDRRHDMAKYLREKNIRWFADWPQLVQAYLGPDPAKLGWSQVATDGWMALYHYDGPPAAETDRSGGR